MIAYYSRAFVCGDERGYRVAVVVRIDRTEDEFPVQLDTGEPLPLTNKMKLLQDKFGNTLESEKAKWRSLRSFRLVDGCFNAPTRSSTLAAEIRAAVADSFTAVLGRSHQENQDRRPQRATLVAQQEKVVEDAISSDSSSCVPNTDATLTEPDGDVELYVGWPSQRVVNEPSCSPVIDLTCSPSKVSAKRDGSAGSASEGPRSGEVGEGLPDEHGVDIGTDDDADSMDVVTALAEYEGVPTPHLHRAICHRTKTSRNPWHVTKSRRSQYKAKRRPIKARGKSITLTQQRLKSYNG
ncbi:hypothetical protein PF008_g12440 [Phytophthora fragariae]|uniref:Uncharacterized protein n=1 Tax=Phytophthora fragariae TaxID=53985 RepID=A0A6G0RMZ2_9STRA|nr:hypothetical protein PF008_g12440 [Phytophthora fragariae]